ncbi:MAG: hypothetical protein IJS95_04975 [Prevotella sp.]|nr:hypothetical protein [Prevotella sp.]
MQIYRVLEADGCFSCRQLPSAAVSYRQLMSVFCAKKEPSGARQEPPNFHQEPSGVRQEPPNFHQEPPGVRQEPSLICA